VYRFFTIIVYDGFIFIYSFIQRLFVKLFFLSRYCMVLTPFYTFSFKIV